MATNLVDRVALVIGSALGGDTGDVYQAAREVLEIPDIAEALQAREAVHRGMADVERSVTHGLGTYPEPE